MPIVGECLHPGGRPERIETVEIIIFATVVAIIWFAMAFDGADSRKDDARGWYPVGTRHLS
jgi:hypothetical protein